MEKEGCWPLMGIGTLFIVAHRMRRSVDIASSRSPGSWWAEEGFLV